MNRVLLVLGLLGLCAACGPSRGAPAGAEGSVPPTSGNETTTESNPSPPTLRLVEAGAEPRVELRLAPPDGSTRTLEIVTDMHIASSSNGTTQVDYRAPRLRVRVSLGPTRMTEDGFVQMPIRYDAVSLEATPDYPEDALASARAELAPLVGVTGLVRLDPRGFTVHLEMHPPDDLPPTALQTLEQLQSSLVSATTVFPNEPVGVGGAYEVEFDVSGPPFGYHQRTRYRVTSIEGTRVGLAIEIEQTAGEQPMPPSPETQGFEVTLTAMSGQGQGTVTTDLASLASESTMHLAVVMHMSVLVQGQPTQTESHVDTNVEVRPAQ